MKNYFRRPIYPYRLQRRPWSPQRVLNLGIAKWKISEKLFIIIKYSWRTQNFHSVRLLPELCILKITKKTISVLSLVGKGIWFVLYWTMKNFLSKVGTQKLHKTLFSNLLALTSGKFVPMNKFRPQLQSSFKPLFSLTNLPPVMWSLPRKPWAEETLYLLYLLKS